MVSKHAKFSIGMGAIGALLILLVIGIVWPATPVKAANHSDSSVTGYFGIDDGRRPIVDRRGIMLAFDGAIASETVSVNTFQVSLNDGSFADVVETRVEESYVFLRVRDELVSDATPIVGIAEGEEVEDLAGNSTNSRKFGFARIKDGIAPRLLVTLSGGSGRGTGGEGSDRLTNDTIDIRVASDEPLQGAPRVIVVCDDLSWTERSGNRDVERDIDDFIANRNGAFPNKPQEPRGTNYTCGYDANGDGADDPFQLTEDVANSRPGEVWQYSWQNPTGSTRTLRDGALAVVAFARDRSRYRRDGKTVQNWATATADLGLDTDFNSQGSRGAFRVHPPDGSTVTEERPFVIVEIPDATSVRLNSVLFDGVDIAGEFQEVGFNEFVYWPLSMNQGEHEVVVVASDAAGNSIEFDFGFTTVQRGDFVLELQPGWNAISVPANPIDRSIASVFTNPSITTVIGWDPTGENVSPWRVAVRREGGWESNPNFAELKEIDARYGYWVKSTQFAKQRIRLIGPLGEALPQLEYVLAPIRSGWNFIGVVDSDGDQTQDHFGEALRDQNGDRVNAQEYLTGRCYSAAYTWDPILNRFEEILPDESMMIGDGVWLFHWDRCRPPKARTNFS